MIIVKIFPTNIEGSLKIDSIIVIKLNTIRIIKMLPSIDIKDIIIVVLRAQDLPFSSPYEMKK
jgi:hypothetical protein